MLEGQNPERSSDTGTVFELVNLTVALNRRRVFRPTERTLLVEDINLKVKRGETAGICGPSGAGKSTLARAAIGLNPTASGQVLLEGSDILSMSRAELRRVRQRIQLVLQNNASLSPYHRVDEILTEPLRNFGFEKSDWVRRVDEVLEQMSLGSELAGRYPNQLSGGQQQRVSIARALIAEPEVVIFDEPVSSLDRVVQLSVLDDLRRRQRADSLAFVIITHDPDVAAYMCDDVFRLVGGRMV